MWKLGYIETRTLFVIREYKSEQAVFLVMLLRSLSYLQITQIKGIFTNYRVQD